MTKRRWLAVPGALLLLMVSCSGNSDTTPRTASDPAVATSTGTAAGVETLAPSGSTATTGTATGPTMGASDLGSGAVGAPGAATGITAGAGIVTTTGAAGSSGQGIQPGTLTAGTWDDNLNFDFYTAYLKTMEASQISGLPLIPRANRLEILATDGAGAPLANATVTVAAAGSRLLESRTRGDGKLYFFPGIVGADVGAALQITAAVGPASASTTAHVGDATAHVVVAGTTAVAPAALDLAIVLDTTGSMGDELDFLKVEFDDIVARVQATYPTVTQRWALILYRDDDSPSEEYVVRSFDFTDDLTQYQAHLDAQSADGGGDFPESPDKGLAALAKLSWSPTAAARVAFWVADAPHHVGREGAMVQADLTAQGLGIRLYPVSASGTDDLLEYSMREAAEVTGGRYLFLTNDSGVGNDHKEPTIPCYLVTTLQNAMLRMFDLELTGQDVQPAPADVIRTSGNPSNGTCTLDSGQIVQAL